MNMGCSSKLSDYMTNIDQLIITNIFLPSSTNQHFAAAVYAKVPRGQRELSPGLS